MEKQKSKFNWGWGIAIGYGTFAVGMLMLAYNASIQDFHLVSNDYYEQEVNYQQRIDKTANASKLPENVKISQANDKVVLQFPANMKQAKGTVVFYRPSDEGQDKKIAVASNDTNTDTISIADFKKGNWQVQLDWTANGVAYYYEHEMKIK